MSKKRSLFSVGFLKFDFMMTSLISLITISYECKIQNLTSSSYIIRKHNISCRTSSHLCFLLVQSIAILVFPKQSKEPQHKVFHWNLKNKFIIRNNG